VLQRFVRNVGEVFLLFDELFPFRRQLVKLLVDLTVSVPN
jgi:hypothetical protein